MKLQIAVLPGDGIGPEITQQSIKVLKAVAERFNHNFVFENCIIGTSAFEDIGDPLPQETLDCCLKSDAVLFGSINHPKFDYDLTARMTSERGVLKLHRELGLFANIRPVKTFEKLSDFSPLRTEKFAGVDLVIYRELTGGIDFEAQKLENDGQSALDVRTYTVTEVERISHLAFQAAQQRKKKLTLVDKTNVLETSRLWRKTVIAVSEEYPDVVLEFLSIENAVMKMLLDPGKFDVILTENIFGEILSNEGAALGGNIGLLASASIGPKLALFEPAPGVNTLGKKDSANPLGSILSAAMLLEYFNLKEEAAVVKAAVEESLRLNISTSDINSNQPYSTEKVGDLLASLINESGQPRLNDENMNYGKMTII